MNKQQQEDFGMMKSDITWLKDNNKEQNQKIDDIHNKLIEFIEAVPKCFADKKVEVQVQSLTNWKHWITGGMAIFVLVIGWILIVLY